MIKNANSCGFGDLLRQSFAVLTLRIFNTVRSAPQLFLVSHPTPQEFK